MSETDRDSVFDIKFWEFLIRRNLSFSKDQQNFECFLCQCAFLFEGSFFWVPLVKFQNKKTKKKKKILKMLNRIKIFLQISQLIIQKKFCILLLKAGSVWSYLTTSRQSPLSAKRKYSSAGRSWHSSSMFCSSSSSWRFTRTSAVTVRRKSKKRKKNHKYLCYYVVLKINLMIKYKKRRKKYHN